MHTSHSSRFLCICLTLATLACSGEDDIKPTGLAGLPAPRTFAFVPKDSGTLPGKQSTNPFDEHEHKKDGVDDSDAIGPFAAVAMWGGNAYYTGGKYNDNDWPVEVGTVTGAPASVHAIRIQPPEHSATKWAASKHALFYRFDEAVDTTFYELLEGALNQVVTVKAEDITAGQWQRIGPYFLSGMKAERVFVVAPEALGLGPFTPLSDSVQGAKIGASALGTHIQLRVKTPGAPADSLTAFKAGPGEHANRYGQNRRFWPVRRGDETGFVWQVPKGGETYVTWLSADMSGAVSHALPLPKDRALAGAVGDDAGAIYALMIQPSEKQLTTREVKIYRLDATAETVTVDAENALDASKKGLNITSFGAVSGSSNQVAMRYSGGKIGMFLARKMHKAGDGLNHQGAISLVVDGESLKVLKNHGQSSGHSFESYLTLDDDGRFLGVDLGDNYPRGVHLHRFDDSGRKSRVVYTFKTKHGTNAKNPAGKTFPAYDGVQSAKQLYQWSNDNSTYTEIGGVVPTEKGLVVVFASEADRLDNGKATGMHNAPRDLASVCVRSDFEEVAKGKSGAWVTDELMVSSTDYTMEGGYYSFGGKWLHQRNAGVRWLTEYADKTDNASRVKVLKLADGGVLVVWERWAAKAYEETFAMKLDAEGAATIGATSLGKQLRLGRREDPVLIGGTPWLVRGDGEGLVLDGLLSK